MFKILWSENLSNITQFGAGYVAITSFFWDSPILTQKKWPNLNQNYNCRSNFRSDCVGNRVGYCVGRNLKMAQFWVGDKIISQKPLRISFVEKCVGESVGVANAKVWNHKMIKKIQTMVQLLSLSTFTRFEEQDFKMKKLKRI